MVNRNGSLDPDPDLLEEELGEEEKKDKAGEKIIDEEEDEGGGYSPDILNPIRKEIEDEF